MRAAVTLLLSALLLSGCEYKDLCYDHNHGVAVTVRFNWSRSPNALLTSRSGESEPVTGAGMTVLFYNLDSEGSEPIRYDFPGRDGGTAHLAAGRYMAVAYNYNTETILYRNYTTPLTLEAYTRHSSIEEGTEVSTRGHMPKVAATEEEEAVILEPDPLWAAASEPFTLEEVVTGHSSGHEDDTAVADYVVTLEPESRILHVHVTITNVANLQYSGQFGCAISGLAPSVQVADGKVGDGNVTQAATARMTGESTLEADFRTFGHCPRMKEGDWYGHILTVYAVLSDGSQWYSSFDVTDQMHKFDNDDEDIYITIDGLPVPKPIVNGSGFTPTVDGWQGMEIEVGM